MAREPKIMSSTSARWEKPWTRVDGQGEDTILAFPARRWMILGVAVAVAIVLLGLTGYVEQWLWMRQLDYVGIFWTVLFVQCAMGLLAFLIVLGFLWLNLRWAVKGGSASLEAVKPWRSAVRRSEYDANAEAFVKLFPIALKGVFAVVSSGIALLFAVALFAQWDTYLRFRYGKFFAFADPLYGVDVGFYVFHLPFYLMLQRALLALLLVTLAMVVAIYMFFGALSQGQRSNPAVGGRAATHISALMALLAAVIGWGFYIGHY
jgi:uncharacterized membrane protein (UPF0182 family)